MTSLPASVDDCDGLCHYQGGAVAPIVWGRWMRLETGQQRAPAANRGQLVRGRQSAHLAFAALSQVQRGTAVFASVPALPRAASGAPVAHDPLVATLVRTIAAARCAAAILSMPVVPRVETVLAAERRARRGG